MARLGRTDRNNKLHLFLPFGVVDRGIHASGVESNVVEVVMENGEDGKLNLGLHKPRVPFSTR